MHGSDGVFLTIPTVRLVVMLNLPPLDLGRNAVKLAGGLKTLPNLINVVERCTK